MAACPLFGRRIPRRTILELDLGNGFVEQVPGGLAARLLRRDRPALRDVVEALERGAGDRRVVGLIVRIGSDDPGLARIEELRDAIHLFRAAGKPAVAFAETFGEFGDGHGGYYLATACDEIWLQPSGSVGLTGIAATVPFVRGTLDRLGIEPRVDRRQEYKTAANSLTEDGFTAPHREELQTLVRFLFDQTLDAITDARSLSRERLTALVDRGPLSPRTARTEGLVDRLAYRDEADEAFKERLHAHAEPLDFASYLKRRGRPARKGNDIIAVIYGVGPVRRGDGRWRAVYGLEMAADSIRTAFREAVRDRRVRAIVFRIDSPGGSYVASDAIRREVARASGAGKPVIVSMGNVAASGGYFIALAADRIVAHPSTLTGSIGAAAGKLVSTEFWRRLGVRWGEVRAGERAGMMSSLRDYSPGEWERVQEELDRVYADFVAKVAEGRRMEPRRLHDVAKGRVWSGAQAHRLGLIDALGGFPRALALAREAAGLPPGARVRRRVYPRKPSLLARLLGKTGSSAGSAGILGLIEQAIIHGTLVHRPADESHALRTPPIRLRW